MAMQRHVLARRRLVTSSLVFFLGGCSWMSFGQDNDKTDAGTSDTAPEREQCTLRAQACANSCKDLGSACTDCCKQNVRQCDRGESYSFSSCPDAK